MPSPRLVPYASALVYGYPAWLLAQVLRQPDVRAEFEARHQAYGTPQPRRDEVFAQVDAIVTAGQIWWELNGGISVDGSPPARIAEAPRPSQADGDGLTTREVADLLDLTPRRVLQIKDQLGGQQRPHGWVFTRSRVQAYLDRPKT